MVYQQGILGASKLSLNRNTGNEGSFETGREERLIWFCCAGREPSCPRRHAGISGACLKRQPGLWLRQSNPSCCQVELKFGPCDSPRGR
jgi:hypothetical protein